MNGRMARTLRILMGAAAAKYKRIVALDVQALEVQTLAEVA